MGKHSKNYLLRVLCVQELYSTYKKPGISDAYIFRTFIQPVYPMSKRTFSTYLGISAKKELKEI